jgi:site-specific recombinase XerD
MKLAKMAKIGKNVYPHLFRHSRATHLADKLTEAQMKIYFGWSGRSDVPSVYVHLSGRDVEEAILKLHGVNTRREETWQVGPQLA